MDNTAQRRTHTHGLNTAAGQQHLPEYAPRGQPHQTQQHLQRSIHGPPHRQTVRPPPQPARPSRPHQHPPRPAPAPAPPRPQPPQLPEYIPRGSAPQTHQHQLNNIPRPPQRHATILRLQPPRISTPRQHPPRPSPAPPRPSPTPATRQTSIPPRPVPTLQELLGDSSYDISQLSMYALKAILSANHVNLTHREQVLLDVSGLVEKVVVLVNQERTRRREEMEEMEERQRREEYARLAREQEEIPQQPPPTRSPNPPSRENANESEVQHSTPQPQSPPRHHSPPPPIITSERTGLCAICQDEDANIVILDCRHLCLCQSCSDRVMASTRECPMCRTRIVTKQRLLRIFKT